ncbi:urease accessory protein UreD [Salipiger sp. IMCC34102]|uniref:urease accessory protein UreD n=1 Tax=Salipiger sp. IMCC34102 TaxID=2510647 RepID=UPI001F5CFADF|nr:urease accessory protein UreD [Salipiger sp. IMCC34102]
MFPKGNDPLTGVLLNTSGGVTGGDRLAVSLEVAPGAALALTTQAAERIYRASEGVARTRNRLTVAPGARLDWVPQETILFDGAALDRRLQAEVAPGGRLFLAEAVVFGRKLSGERLDRVTFTDRIQVTRDGVPLLTDATRIDGADTLARPGVAAGAGAMATLVVVDEAAAALVAPLRAALGEAGGVSAPRAGLLVARVLAEDGYALRAALAGAMSLLAGSPLPPSWRL